MEVVGWVCIWVRSPVFRVSDQANLNIDGDLVGQRSVARRADLTDAQWARLEPLLQRNRKAGRPPRWTKRQLIDGIRWRTRVGCPSRDVPPQYGSWSAVYGLFRRWQRGGVWLLIVKLLQVIADAGGRFGWQVSVDSTIVSAHPHAAGARREGGRQVEPLDHGLGRSRRGWTTKLHLACDQGCRVLAMLITAVAAPVAVHQPSIRSATAIATPSSVAAISSSIERLPPGSTNSPSAIWPRSVSPLSINGYNRAEV